VGAVYLRGERLIVAGSRRVASNVPLRCHVLPLLRNGAVDPLEAQLSGLSKGIHPQTNMADDEVATKAPESDAQQTSTEPGKPEEQSVFPGDSRAQDGPSMGVRLLY
jgi:hypothetical protein